MDRMNSVMVVVVVVVGMLVVGTHHILEVRVEMVVVDTRHSPAGI